MSIRTAGYLNLTVVYIAETTKAKHLVAQFGENTGLKLKSSEKQQEAGLQVVEEKYLKKEVTLTSSLRKSLIGGHLLQIGTR